MCRAGGASSQGDWGMWGLWGGRSFAVLPWALPLPSGVSLGLVVDANGAAWSQTAPKGSARITLSPSPGTSPGEPCSLRLAKPDPPAEPQPPAQLAGHRRQDSDGLQHLHTFLGRKCQVLQGSVSCRQWAEQDLGRAREWVPISDERCRRREGES